MAKRSNRSQSGALQAATLAGFNLGYNGYSNPTLVNYRQWAASSNVYSGQHGSIRRSRWAPVVNQNTVGYTPQASIFDSLYNFRDPTPQELILGDNENKLWAFNVLNSFRANQRLNPYVDPAGSGPPSMTGPWSRAAMLNYVFEMNGLVKQTGRGVNLGTVEGFGLDTPDAALTLTLTAGSITKSIGRNYAWAWENANKSHVSPPSPALSLPVAFNSQQATIQCIQPGTVMVTDGSNTIIGTGTAFTTAWIGRSLWIEGLSTTPAVLRVIAVQDSSHLTVNGPIVGTGNLSTAHFQIIDPQATHIRLYATADGGVTYFRIQRNSFVYSISGTPSSIPNSGLQFIDNDNTEPGAQLAAGQSTTFTSEVAQNFNLAPVIGQFLHEYQSRLIVYGITAAPQTFFYSNVELTTSGSPPESFAPLNQITLPMGDARINGMSSLPTGLIIWSDRHDMFKLTGTLTDNAVSGALALGATIARLPYNLGCASPFAVASTALGTVWLTSDREIYLFTDRYAPRNIGRPVQDLLNGLNPNNISDARMTYLHTSDRNWVALAVATGNSTQNNLLLILDLDMMASNGEPSFFVFDMAKNQPTWYVYNVTCEAIVAGFDDFGLQHLYCADQDTIIDVTWTDGFFTSGQELVVPGMVTLHALGNETAEILKRLERLRFVTNRDPGLLQADGWSFQVESIDDDVFTFTSPALINLLPGISSPTLGNAAAASLANPTQWPALVTRRALEFSPAVFVTKGIKSIQGRRFRITINFPTQAGFYELRAIEAMLRELTAR